MIAGIFLRYIKTYRGINYIPITDEDRFCGLVGDNGIGKSTILEALDCFFNDKSWNFNVATKRSGLIETKPFIVPVFLYKKNELPTTVSDLAHHLSKLALEITEDDVALSNKPHIKKFVAHREQLKLHINFEEYFLLPIGIDHLNYLSLSVFNCRKLVEIIYGKSTKDQSLNQEQLNEFEPLLDSIFQMTEYIYIPKEIDSEEFTKLETAEIQALMGETLNDILESRVTGQQINEINKSLNEFIDKLSKELEIYSYRTPTDRQQNIKKNDVYNLIIQAFFNIRKLHKKQGDTWLEINALSSGEKQKAIIDVAHSLITRHRDSGNSLILGVDEPESSLHMSACFDQFTSLYDISRSCRQLLFATHWYGFFPTIENGSAAIITRDDSEHFIDLINLASHREQIKQLTTSSKGLLPYDIRLKSINDFVQSIITSSIGKEPYNWLICEGSSEKIYFSHYFNDLVKEQRLRIVPVGGAKEIKRLYAHLNTSYEEFKDEITGKIILISDTDIELVRYESKQPQGSHLICKRMVSDASTQEIKLVTIESNPVSPKTEIEDALNGLLFRKTLEEFNTEFPDELGFIKDLPKTEQIPSFFALDLRDSERRLLDSFFDKGNNKFRFAAKYVEKLTEKYSVPSWIEEIRDLLTQKKGKSKAR